MVIRYPSNARNVPHRDHSAWKRSAIATNVDWIGKAYKMFAWMTPGEVEVYGLDQLEQAKSWVAA